MVVVHARWSGADSHLGSPDAHAEALVVHVGVVVPERDGGLGQRFFGRGRPCGGDNPEGTHSPVRHGRIHVVTVQRRVQVVVAAEVLRRVQRLHYVRHDAAEGEAVGGAALLLLRLGRQLSVPSLDSLLLHRQRSINLGRKE